MLTIGVIDSNNERELRRIRRRNELDAGICTVLGMIAFISSLIFLDDWSHFGFRPAFTLSWRELVYAFLSAFISFRHVIVIGKYKSLAISAANHGILIGEQFSLK